MTYEQLREELDTGWPWPISGVQKWFESLWNTISQWVYDAAKTVWTWIPDWIKKALQFIQDLATKAWSSLWDFVKDPVGTLQRGFNAIVTSVTTAFDGALDFIGKGIADILAGVTSALGEGLKSVVDWLVKHLTWLGEMIIGAINAVVSIIKSSIEDIIKGFLNAMTGAMAKGSPPPELAQTMNVMIEATWTRQIELIKKAYSSPPSPGGVTESAIGIAAALGLAGVGSIALGLAADQAHPIKNMGLREVATDVVGMVGVPSVIHSIMTMPTATALITPLRYGLMEMFTPLQPGAQDIVRFAVRECFDPNRLSTLLAFYPGEAYSKAMAREGYASDWAKMYWGAHWVLPPIDMLNEYLYRHDEFIKNWESYIRYHDYIPESIPWLREVIYHPFTRVDLRRMWEMRVITEADMYREYRWLGYDHDHATKMVTWTKVEMAEPIIRARYKSGWITGDVVMTELLATGLPSDRARELYETIVKAEAPARTTVERDLTKAEIIKGWKKGILTDREAVYLLIDLGYEEWEALYLLDINRVVAAGDPEGYWEMRKVVEGFKRAMGRPHKEVPETLITLERKLRECTQALEVAKNKGATGAVLRDLESKLSTIKGELDKLVKKSEL